MRTTNPALSKKTFQNIRAYSRDKIMTIQGAVNKTFILLFLTIFSASWVWDNFAAFAPFIIPAVVLGLITAIVTIFKKEWAPVTSVIYALVEGVVLGGISVMMEKQYPGIVVQAVGLTFGILFSLLFLYKSRIIKVTQKFRLGVFAATGGIFLIYMASLVMGFFGLSIPFIHQASPFGIGFSVFVVIIAALNLVLDFDFIERASSSQLPKYMEWYCAFGLMVTLIWLYIEILRLLSKLRQR